jgi:hypothetical protein
MRSHDFDRVELLAEGYVLTCSCGWRSPAHRTAEVVGSAWDHHLAETSAD